MYRKGKEMAENDTIYTPSDLKKTRYTKEEHFHCLENLTETPIELSLIHCGMEECRPLHIWHGVRYEYIIHFVRDGHGVFSVDNRTYHLSKGQMFLIWPKVEITYIADETDPWKYCWIGFRGSAAERALSDCGFGPQVDVLDAPALAPIEKNISLILDHYEQVPGNMFLRASCLLSILGYLMESAQRPAEQETGSPAPYSRTNVYVTRAISYIKLHFADDLTIVDIAGAVGISRAYLNRAFQKELGMSVQHFLIDYRLHVAASLLMNTTLSVSEIAENVGYDDPLAFSKAFRKKFQLSPRNYRQSNHAMNILEKRIPDDLNTQT